MLSSEKKQVRNLPAHVAIIMDGNGRWATRQNKPRSFGHRAGEKAVERTIEAAADLGVKYLTLFGFSTENWKRPRDEVNELMRLLRHYLKTKMDDLAKQNIRIRVIGDRARLPADIVAQIELAEAKSAGNTKMTVVIALSYSGRFDLAQAARSLAAKHASGDIDLREITEDTLAQHLQTKGIPDPDLLIRTSGERRISNFLLWQCAYAEFFFSHVYWPDFDKEALREAIDAYTGRNRRYGGLCDRKAS